MRSIFGQVLNCAVLHDRARFMRASGWGGGYKRTNVKIGYHKQLPRAEMKVLAWQVEHNIEPSTGDRKIKEWLKNHGL